MSGSVLVVVRQRLIDDMTARRYDKKVQKAYVRHVRTFAAFACHERFAGVEHAFCRGVSGQESLVAERRRRDRAAVVVARREQDRRDQGSSTSAASCWSAWKGFRRRRPPMVRRKRTAMMFLEHERHDVVGHRRRPAWTPRAPRPWTCPSESCSWLSWSLSPPDGKTHALIAFAERPRRAAARGGRSGTRCAPRRHGVEREHLGRQRRPVVGHAGVAAHRAYEGGPSTVGRARPRARRPTGTKQSASLAGVTRRLRRNVEAGRRAPGRSRRNTQ